MQHCLHAAAADIRHRRGGQGGEGAMRPPREPGRIQHQAGEQTVQQDKTSLLHNW